MTNINSFLILVSYFELPCRWATIPSTMRYPLKLESGHKLVGELIFLVTRMKKAASEQSSDTAFLFLQVQSKLNFYTT